MLQRKRWSREIKQVAQDHVTIIWLEIELEKNCLTPPSKVEVDKSINM